MNKAAIVPLLVGLAGCYGTYRTADVLKEGQRSLDFNTPLYVSEDSAGNQPLDSPSAQYRWGTSRKADMGIKVYCLGLMLTGCKQLIGESRYYPAVALQGGLGAVLYVAGIAEGTLITSKKFKACTPYAGLRASAILGDKHTGVICMGVYSGLRLGPTEWVFLQPVSLFLECYYGDLHQEILEGDNLNSRGFVGGAGFSIDLKRKGTTPRPAALGNGNRRDSP
jgi:hypothetical protein